VIPQREACRLQLAARCALHPEGCAWLDAASSDVALLRANPERFERESPRRRRMGNRAARLAASWRDPSHRPPSAPTLAERHLAEHLEARWQHS